MHATNSVQIYRRHVPTAVVGPIVRIQPLQALMGSGKKRDYPLLPRLSSLCRLLWQIRPSGAI